MRREEILRRGCTARDKEEHVEHEGRDARITKTHTLNKEKGKYNVGHDK